LTPTQQPTSTSRHQFSRIILVRLRQIGDVVFTTPAIAALRKRFPAAHLTYLVEPAAAPVVAGNPHLDEVIVAPRTGGIGGLVADLRLGGRLKRGRYDLAIDFHGGPRASLLTLLSGATRRVGYNVVGRAWMYTDVVDRPRELRRRHSVENQWDLLDVLSVPRPTPAANPLEMPIDRDAVSRVAERLAAAGVAPNEEIAVIHVTASSPFRTWPLPAFVETVAALATRPGRRVIVTSGRDEAGVVNTIVTAAREKLAPDARQRVMIGSDLSLAELRALLEIGAVYVGGDSGPLHLAATTGVPIVAIFGPTPSERSAPWRDPLFSSASIEIDGLPCRPCDQRVCEPGDFRCLTRIEPARVVSAAERLLAGRARTSQPHADVR
jgi:lipopolysaccharide heptosyltransferase II